LSYGIINIPVIGTLSTFEKTRTDLVLDCRIVDSDPGLGPGCHWTWYESAITWYDGKHVQSISVAADV